MDKKEQPYDVGPLESSSVRDSQGPSRAPSQGPSRAPSQASSQAQASGLTWKEASAQSSPTWKVGEAKQRFPELLRCTQEEPQVICKRDTPVAAVLRYEDFLEFQAWRRQHRRRPLAAIIQGLTEACAEEDYSLEVPERRNRPTPFDDAPLASEQAATSRKMHENS